MVASDGALFPMRSEFGAFVSNEFAEHATNNASGSIISHVQALAVRLERAHNGINVFLDDGTCLTSEFVVVTTSNEHTAIPSAISVKDAAHDRFIADPWQLSDTDGIKPDARVLILGAGLTAADIMTTILREKPNVSITAISRSGIKSTSRPKVALPVSQSIWDRITTSPSLFEQRHGSHDSVRKIFNSLRRAIKDDAASGLPWQTAFDELRDSVRRVWMGLSESEKLRFQRHLRRRYDSCRFRYPPQIEPILETAEKQGRLAFRKGNIDHVGLNEKGFIITWTDADVNSTHNASFDNIVNCIGPPNRSDQGNNPFLKAIIKDRYARTPSLGVGIDVNDKCQVIAENGRPQTDLYAFGPLTFATFGTPLGVPFIVDQIIRAIPIILKEIQA